MKSSVFIAVDGRAGAGKTSVTEQLAKLLGRRGSVAVISLKDLYSGWDGLVEGIHRCDKTVLDPLLQGRPVKWLAWDWAAGEYSQERVTEPADFVILEGTGAGAAPLRAHCEVVVWIEASGAPACRNDMGSRDKGDAAHWKRWAVQEDALYSSDDVSLAASIVVSPNGEFDTSAAAGNVLDALSELPALHGSLGSSEYSKDEDAILVRHHYAKPDPEYIFDQLFGSSSNAVWLDASDAGTPEAGPRSRFSIMADDAGSRGRRMSHHNGLTEVVFGPGTATPATARLHQPFFQWLGSVWGQTSSGTSTHPTGPPGLECGFELGWLGYLGYGLKRECGGHDVPALGKQIPDAQLLFAGRAVIIDHEKHEIWLLALNAPDAAPWLDHAEHVFAEAHPLPAAPAAVGQTPVFQARDAADTYRSKVLSAKAEITEGNTYEVCLTTTLEATLELTSATSGPDPWQIYRTLRRQSPAPFAAFARFGALTIASSSPERFLSIAEDGAVRAEPIKGTRRRSPHADRNEDASVRAELAANPKDRAENLMIVDLLRNDVSHFAVPGSVTVSRLFSVETYSTVHQLVSTVDAQLRPETARAQVLAAAFPPGSMTGAPKIRTMGILDHLESGPRGVYSGAIGYFSRNGASDLSVVIRTLVMHRVDDTMKLTIGVGGAIVADSTPEAEHEEIRTKAWALLNVLGTEFPE
ncbi:aminodeoxychorismate synthase component I [Arthrobacter sp. NPDC056727]|uniref:aminodeoxychorismate synthase component I n=1 Tax=Arthrobacter sp. NPDC056727 TaxID=3345927 RepID=UPI00366F91C0